MLTKKWQWLAILAVFATALAACSPASESGEGGSDGSVTEPPAAEAPTDDSGDGESVDEPAGEPEHTEDPAGAPAEAPASDPAAELSVETGAEVEIETQIEGMTEKVQVVEYTLKPSGIQYALRNHMGEPTVEDGKVVYKTQMGDDVATVTIEVKEGVSVDDAVAEAKQHYADGFEGGELQDLNAEWYAYPGKSQHYRKDGYYHGFDVVDVEGRLIVIHHSYPFDAGDGMGAVMHEMLASIKG